MTLGTRNTTAAVFVITLLTLGTGWFAYGQMATTNAAAVPQTMERPLVRDLHMERKVEELAKRVSSLEATVERLNREISDLKRASKK
jgi:hypothetical protein